MSKISSLFRGVLAATCLTKPVLSNERPVVPRLGGLALADLLSGAVNPSGRMPSVTPKRPEAPGVNKGPGEFCLGTVDWVHFLRFVKCFFVFNM